MALSTIGVIAVAFVLHIVWGLALLRLAAFPHVGESYTWLFKTNAAHLGAPVKPVPPPWLPAG